MSKEQTNNQIPHETVDMWAIVELFGHQKIAGRITEQSIGGNAMLRVDVPQVNEQKAYTRFFGNGAIYSINPCDESIARAMVERCSAEPVRRYELPKLAEVCNDDGFDESNENDFGEPEDERDED